MYRHIRTVLKSAFDRIRLELFFPAISYVLYAQANRKTGYDKNAVEVDPAQPAFTRRREVRFLVVGVCDACSNSFSFYGALAHRMYLSEQFIFHASECECHWNFITLYMKGECYADSYYLLNPAKY